MTLNSANTEHSIWRWKALQVGYNFKLRQIGVFVWDCILL